jgi:hypothetical protein
MPGKHATREIAGRNRDEIHVRMTSEVFGNEDFYYDDAEAALAAIWRLCLAAGEQDDGVERLIGIVVNGEADDAEEES